MNSYISDQTHTINPYTVQSLMYSMSFVANGKHHRELNKKPKTKSKKTNMSKTNYAK